MTPSFKKRKFSLTEKLLETEMDVMAVVVALGGGECKGVNTEENIHQTAEGSAQTVTTDDSDEENKSDCDDNAEDTLIVI